MRIQSPTVASEIQCELGSHPSKREIIEWLKGEILYWEMMAAGALNLEQRAACRRYAHILEKELKHLRKRKR